MDKGQSEPVEHRTISVLIPSDGSVQFLFNEELFAAVSDIGQANMERASHIDWNGFIWQVLTPDKSQVLYENISRKACLKWEEANLQL